MSAFVLLLAATPSPSPTVESSSGGSPGFLGFVFTFALALAAAGLFLSLTRHLRKVDRRARELEADEPADAGPDAPAGDETDDPR